MQRQTVVGYAEVFGICGAVQMLVLDGIQQQRAEADRVFRDAMKPFSTRLAAVANYRLGGINVR